MEKVWKPVEEDSYRKSQWISEYSLNYKNLKQKIFKYTCAKYGFCFFRYLIGKFYRATCIGILVTYL